MKCHRRGFLQRSWHWLSGLGLAVVLYPAWRLASFHLPRKPRKVKVDRRLTNGAFHLGDDFVLFQEDGHTWAVSRICTHLGCRLGYAEEEGLLVCPCHGSRFTRQGKRVAGPAQRDLAAYPVERLTGEGGYVVTL